MSKPTLKPYIIGAGGVASYLLPILTRTFALERVIIQDADILEPRNLDRQLFDQSAVGKNKAMALAELTLPPQIELTVIPEFFKAAYFGMFKDDYAFDEDDFDVIICVCDNHKARCDALALADDYEKPCVLGGNEYFDSQAYIYHPDMHGTEFDPRVRYPDILTDVSGDPTSCQGVAQEASPQLALANCRCAVQIMDLLWMHLHIAPTKHGGQVGMFAYELSAGVNYADVLVPELQLSSNND